MKKVLVTGSKGFIGRHLVDALQGTEYEIFTLDVKNEKAGDSSVDISTADLDSIFLRIKPDVVIHLAAQVDVTESFVNPIRDLEINGIGTLKVLHASQTVGCNNFIYVASGGAIYDSDSPMPLTERSPERPVSPYGLSKRLGEDYVRVLSAKAGTSWTSLALSNCYGQVEDHQRGVIFQFWKALSEERVPTIYGPDVMRDFIHVSDVVAAILKAIENPINTRVNISSQTEISLLDLFRKIATIMRSEIEPNILSSKSGDVLRSCLSNQKAKELLGWKPLINLESGLEISLPRVGNAK